MICTLCRTAPATRQALVFAPRAEPAAPDQLSTETRIVFVCAPCSESDALAKLGRVGAVKPISPV
ncbi:MAG TPA: hypothetical protein VEI02_16165 [Planctomycetota bacterium]|nr:hypothetical protein [Planctomycetota bacterium]